MAGEIYLYSAGDKLPESTGDKLPAGEMDSNFPGEIFELYWESDSIECLVYRQGTILDQDCQGCSLRMFVYRAGEC